MGKRVAESGDMAPSQPSCVVCLKTFKLNFFHFFLWTTLYSEKFSPVIFCFCLVGVSRFQWLMKWRNMLAKSRLKVKTLA